VKDVELLEVGFMSEAWEWLGEHVGGVLVAADRVDLELAIANELPDVVVTNVNMFDFRMGFGGFRQVDRETNA
jgi:hypothetical protein